MFALTASKWLQEEKYLKNAGSVLLLLLILIKRLLTT